MSAAEPVAADSLRVRRGIDQAADKLYREAEKIGAALAVGEIKPAQLGGLEAVANSSPRLTDLFDYVKRQTAKAARGRTWRTDLDGEAVGLVLLELLSAKTEAEVAGIEKGLGLTLEGLARQKARLVLARLLVRQVVVHCKFAAEGLDQ